MSNPPEVEDICILSQEEVLEDGDEGAKKNYYPLEDKVAAFVTTDIGRAIVDLNRAEDVLTPILGGYIIRSHSAKIPWIQIEYSRAPFLSHEHKSNALIEALSEWSRELIE